MAARAAAAERRAFRAGSSQDQGTENAGSAFLNQENELEDVEGGGVDDDDIDYSYDDADDDDEEEVEVIDHELADGTVVLLDEADGSVYDANTFEALGKLDKKSNAIVPDDSDNESEEDVLDDTLNGSAAALHHEEDDAIYDTEASDSAGKLKHDSNTTLSTVDNKEDSETDDDEEGKEDAVIHTLADGTVVFLDQLSGIVYDVDSFEALGTLDEEANEIVEIDEYDYYDDEYGTWEGEVDDWDFNEDDDEDEFVVLEEVSMHVIFLKLFFSS